jgi:hypothetical protein
MFISIAGIHAAYAQTEQVAKAEIPFGFYAQGTKMPAGTYMIGLDMENKVITLTDRSNDHMKFVAGYQADDGNSPQLVFDHVGGSYLLKQIETVDMGIAVPEPKTSNLEKRSDVASIATVALQDSKKGE